MGLGQRTAPPQTNYLNAKKGVWSWITTVDQKSIGIMYLIMILTSFFLGGMFALVLRLALLNQKHTLFGKVIFDAETYNRVFTLHVVIMVFLFIIPPIPAALGNFVLPLMLGAKDIAFPRLNLASLYICAAGAIFALTAMFTGGVDTGWTFYTLYGTTTNSQVSLMTMAAFILGFCPFSAA